MKLDTLSPWELLSKKMIWKQLEFVKGMKVLDFGSGEGITACYFAEKELENEVTAVEPSARMLETRWTENEYVQVHGGVKDLCELKDESFDIILCHTVFEYIEDREEILKEFDRLLKKGGKLSVLKHNRAGRVMQMTVLMNNFKRAKELLDGHSGMASQFGNILYYEDGDITKWCESFELESVKGIMTFWDLQQERDMQGNPVWQEGMLEIEHQVESLQEYVNISFYHHNIYKK